MYSQINIDTKNIKEPKTTLETNISIENNIFLDTKILIIHNYNNSTNYEIYYNTSDLLYLKDLKNKLKKKYNNNNNNYIFLNDFIILKKNKLLNDIKNIIIIQKNFFNNKLKHIPKLEIHQKLINESNNKSNENDKTNNETNDKTNDSENDESNDESNDETNNDLDINHIDNDNNNNSNLITDTNETISTAIEQKKNNDLLYKYFKLFDKYPDLIIFVYLLNYDLNFDNIIHLRLKFLFLWI